MLYALESIIRDIFFIFLVIFYIKVIINVIKAENIDK